jgi:hypothetical protein
MDYLRTWNSKYIANARMRLAIEVACRRAGYEPPMVDRREQL